MNSFTSKYFKKIPVGLILLLLLFLALIYIISWLAHEVVGEKEAWIDQSVFEYLRLHVISPGLTSVMKSVTFFASAAFLSIAYVVVFIVLYFEKLYRRMLEVFVIGLGGFLIIYFMKIIFQRARPSYPLLNPLLNYSFPSGHATSGFIFYGLLGFLLWKTTMNQNLKILIGIALIIFALLIGFSRIYLRMHYTSDVVAGFCVGAAWMILSAWVLEKLKKQSRQELNS